MSNFYKKRRNNDSEAAHVPPVVVTGHSKGGVDATNRSGGEARRCSPGGEVTTDRTGEEGNGNHGGGRKQFRLSPMFSALPRKVNTRVSIRDMLKRNKSSKNGFPGMVSHSLEVDDPPPPYPLSLEARPLSAATDRTYNALLQSKVTASRIHSKTSLQARVYNFLERPTGWKCFIYHFTV